MSDKRDVVIAAVRAALTLAAEDGSYDNLSAPVRALLSDAFLGIPAADGLDTPEKLVAKYAEDAEFYRVTGAKYREGVKMLAEVARPHRIARGETSTVEYNRHGYPQYDSEADLDALRGFLNKEST